MMNADGTGQEQLTNDGFEKRGGHLVSGRHAHPVRVQNGPKTPQASRPSSSASWTVHTALSARLTFNNVSELTPTWSPDGLAIVFQKAP